MAARPPLPFGLGRDPQCAPHRCLSPDTPLPAPGTPLHDQVAAALSQLFQTFFSTSLRYLGVSEILDWLETSGTVDAWILSGLEGGRLPDEIADERNLAFGKEAFRQVVKNALDADGGAWATSLRETGFSSAMSMAFEGVIAQVRPLPRQMRLKTMFTPVSCSSSRARPLLFRAFTRSSPRPASACSSRPRSNRPFPSRPLALRHLLLPSSPRSAPSSSLATLSTPSGNRPRPGARRSAKRSPRTTP